MVSTATNSFASEVAALPFRFVNDVVSLLGSADGTCPTKTTQKPASTVTSVYSRTTPATGPTKSTSRSTPTPTEPTTTATDQEDVCGPKLDLVLVFDVSGSVKDVFDRQKSIALDLLGSLSIGPEATRVAVIAFADTASIEVSLSPSQTRQSVLKQVSDIEFTGGNTATAQAVRLAIRSVLLLLCTYLR